MVASIMKKIEMESYRRQLTDEYMASVFMRCVVPKSLREVLNEKCLSLMSDKVNALICQDQANEEVSPGLFWDAFLEDAQWQQRWPRRSITDRVAIIESSFPIVPSSTLCSDNSLSWLHHMMASGVDTYYAIGSGQHVVIAKDVRGLSDLMVIRSEMHVTREEKKKHVHWHTDQRILSNRTFCYGLLSAWRQLDQPVQRRLAARDVLIHDVRTMWSEAIQQWTANSIDTSPFIYRCGSDVKVFQDYMHRRVNFDNDTPDGIYLNDYNHDIGYYAVPDVWKNGRRLMRWLSERTPNVWEYLVRLQSNNLLQANLNTVILPARSWWPFGEKRSVTAWIVEGMHQLNLDQALVEFSFAFTCLVTYRGYRYERMALKEGAKKGEESLVVES